MHDVSKSLAKITQMEELSLQKGKVTAPVLCSALPKRIIKFPFKRKACQVYEGGCCRQVSTVVSLVVW